MSFLPEEDREFLAFKKIPFEEYTENNERGLILLENSVPGNLFVLEEKKLLTPNSVSILIIIPSGYNTTMLDSFYTWPRLVLSTEREPNRADTKKSFKGNPDWQFWSRHLQPSDWSPSIDGLSKYLQFVKQAMKDA